MGVTEKTASSSGLPPHQPRSHVPRPPPPQPLHRIFPHQIHPKPQDRLSLAHLGSHVHPIANQSTQEDGRWAWPHLGLEVTADVGGWGQCCSVPAMAQGEGGCVHGGRPKVDRGGRAETELTDAPVVPRPRAGQRVWEVGRASAKATELKWPEKGFEHGLHPQLRRQWCLPCFASTAAVKSAGGPGSRVEASLQNGSPCPDRAASYVHPEKQSVK